MPAQLFAAEAFLPGHPDLLADAAADAVADAALRRDPHARCEVAVALRRGRALVTGRLAGEGMAEVDVAAAVRLAFTAAGHGPDWPPDPAALAVEDDLSRDPPGPADDGPRLASEQAVSVGHAVDLPGTNYLPGEHYLARRLAGRLARLRAEATELRPGPDGRVVLLVEEDELPRRLAGFSASLQQAADGPGLPLRKKVLAALEAELYELAQHVPGFDPHLPAAVAVNEPGGVARGVEGCAGLSGRRPSGETYGPRVAAGLGLCGKDLYHPARAGAVAARRLAKAAVLTGAARECKATLTLVPGRAEAQVVALVGDGRLLDASRWAPLLDRSLSGVGGRYTGRVTLADVARGGHFTDPALPWEHLHFDRERP